MQVNVLKQLNEYVLTKPVTTMVRCEVELDGKFKAYVVCYKHNGHVMFLPGRYFICKGQSEQFFKLHCKEADMAIDLTSDEEAEYGTYRPRSFQEMEAYIHG